MPAHDPVDVANAALTMNGVGIISALEEDSDPARFILSNYELLVENEISMYPWPFATENVALGRLTDAPTDVTWDAAYQLPSDVVYLRTVEVNGFTIRYSRAKNTIECNANANDTVIATYVARVDEHLWPPYFRSLITLRLATMVALGLTEQPTRGEVLNKLAEEQLLRARHVSSLQQTNESLLTKSRIASIRRSGVIR